MDAGCCSNRVKEVWCRRSECCKQDTVLGKLALDSSH